MARMYIARCEVPFSKGLGGKWEMKRQGNDSSHAAVNLIELLERLEDDHDLLCELIGIFKEDFPRILKSLQQAVACEDIKNVEVTSHALKGMLSGLSITRAATMASRIERMASAGEKSGLTDALTLLECEVATLLPELNAYAEEKKV